MRNPARLVWGFILGVVVGLGIGIATCSEPLVDVTITESEYNDPAGDDARSVELDGITGEVGEENSHGPPR
ncbi:MAG: hypothetical protein ACYTDX_05625 [Planctomycetota bacterium]|jgi:hypothetical protein